MNNWYGSENWDVELFGAETLKSRIVNRVNQSLLRSVAVVPKKQPVRNLSREQLDQLTSVYDLLADDPSKSTLIKLISFRMLGHRKIKMPVNTSSYWSDRNLPRTFRKSANTIPIKFRGWVLEHLSLEKIGFPIEIFTLPGGVHIIFMLKQYVYGKRSPEIKAEAGDFVIDAGGGWGDTALFFAHEVGPHGKVFTLEFCPDNLEVLQRNLDLNRELSNRIEIVTRALWNQSGLKMAYSADGPATAVAREGSLEVATLSIDDLVKEARLPRVDYIKMDIEGSELKALQGAKETLRTFRPRLAVSVYHKPDDLTVIPNYLNELGLGYEFFLDHFTIYEGETVLFANPKN